jgi:hypothetical protein
MSDVPVTVACMATQAAIERWDKVLYEVEKAREGWRYPEAMTPAYRDFVRGLPMLIETIFSPFLHAWDTDRPDEGSDLFRILEPVARAAAAPLDFTRAALPQVGPMMAVVAEARSQLAELEGPPTAAEVVAEIEHLLKVTVLVARVSHQGSMKIVDDELKARFEAINKNTTRGAKYLDLHTFQAVEQPSKTTISMQVVMSMVDPGIATLEERMRPFPEESYPPIMKQFAAQWVVNVYTEWDEHFRGELATALGCDKDDVRSDYFADLGKMRHDYVHNRGICRNSARNNVLKWFHKGDKMIPKHTNYLQLMEAFPAEELRTIKPSPVSVQRQPVKANADRELIRQFLAAADNQGINKDVALDQRSRRGSRRIRRPRARPTSDSPDTGRSSTPLPPHPHRRPTGVVRYRRDASPPG